MPFSVAFRVDASPEIATGHLMRCLSLARTLLGRGCRVRMLTRSLAPGLDRVIGDAGVEHVMLRARPHRIQPEGTAHAHWLGTTQCEDADDSMLALADASWDRLVVDHYAIDADWERRVGSEVGGVMAIDDLADRPHAVGLLLDQNVFSDMESRYQRHVPDDARLLLGPRFALLRPEFASARRRTTPRSGKIEHVLVSYGGVDPYNLTERTVEALAMLGADAQPLTADVVVGLSHARLDRLVARCGKLGYDVHVQTDRMTELIQRADLAFGATGSTSWERCCLGLPSVCVPTSFNQVAIAEGLALKNAIVLVPDPAECTSERFLTLLRRLRASPREVRALSESAWALVDGEGAGRVADQLLEAW